VRRTDGERTLTDDEYRIETVDIEVVSDGFDSAPTQILMRAVRPSQPPLLSSTTMYCTSPYGDAGMTTAEYRDIYGYDPPETPDYGRSMHPLLSVILFGLSVVVVAGGALVGIAWLFA